MIVADHGVAQLVLLKRGENEVVLASPTDDEPHEIEVYKRTETSFGIVTIKGLILSKNAELLAPPPLPNRRLLFIGDSVTCGGGVQRNEQCKEDPVHPANDGYDTFGMVLARRLDADVELVCFGGRGLERDYRGLGKADGVLNAPQFLDLAIPSDNPKTRAIWDSSRWQADAIVVSLGTNDFNLQKTKPLDETSWVKTYVDFVRSIRHDYPRAIVLLTEGAMVTDPLLRSMVQKTVAALQDPGVKYMQSTHYKGNSCNGHPTQAQHMHMADDMEPIIRMEMHW